MNPQIHYNTEKAIKERIRLIIMKEETSKVYFMNARAKKFEESIIEKTKRLFDEAGFSECIEKGDKVAIKVHFGELNSTRYLRPSIVRCVVEKVKEAGGDPFVCETQTVHAGPWASRITAQDLLRNAAAHGFTAETVGCPIIPADGWIGDDDIIVPIDGHILKKIYVAKAIALADAMIVISHTYLNTMGVTGSIKKVGVGCISKRGKYLLHYELPKYPKLSVAPEKCLGLNCKWATICENSCPMGAIKISEKIEIDHNKCNMCGICVWICQFLAQRYAVYHKRDKAALNVLRIADSAAGVLKCFENGKVGYFNYMFDIIGPLCECYPWSDIPLLPDIGILASKDIVAIDAAALEMLLNTARNVGKESEINSFLNVNPFILIEKAEELMLGSRKFELIEVDPVFIPPQSKVPYLRRVFKKWSLNF